MGKILKYILIIFLISLGTLHAQLCPECDLSCIECDDIDGFTGNNSSTGPGVGPAGFCTIIQHQMLWLGFVAGSEDLSIQVDVGPCTSGSLEIGIFEAIDCNDATLISNCYGGANGNAIPNGQSGIVTANQPLVIGQYYFLVFDVTSGPPAGCDFTLSVIDGETGAEDINETASLDQGVLLCDGDDYDFEPEFDGDLTSYEWELNGSDAGESLSYNFDESDYGTYTLCATPFNFCSEGDQVCTEITVGESYEEYYYIQACYEDCAIFEGEIYCNDGERDFEYETIYGCDSIIYLEIEWYNSEDEHYLGEIVLCQGETFEYEGEDYYETGTYFVELEDPNECDSIVEFDLLILDTIIVDIFDTICVGEIYTWQGDTLMQSGMYSDTSFTLNGCDSLTHLNFTILESFEVFLNEEICGGQGFTVGDMVLTNADTYQILLSSADGCDSIVNLELNISDTIYVDYFEALCPGETLRFGDSLYVDEGIYQHDYVTESGCDSIELLTISLLQNSESLLREVICAGESVIIEGQTYEKTGEYELMILNSVGCDSLIRLDLEVLEPRVEDLVYFICPGDSVSIYGEFYFDEGLVTRTGLASNGCDSIINAELIYNEEYEFTISESICEGEAFDFEGSSYSQTGSYVRELISLDGCDSILILELNVNDTILTRLNTSICEGDTYLFRGEELDSTGEYQDLLISEQGCDSLVVLDLVIDEIHEEFLVESICEGDSVYFVDKYIDAEGSYERILTNRYGCDSTVVMELEVRLDAYYAFDMEICEFDSYEFNGMLLSDEGEYEYVLNSSNGCDSIVSLNLSLNDCSAIYDIQQLDPLCWDSEDGSIHIEIESAEYPVKIEWQNMNNSNFEGAIDLLNGETEFSIYQLAGGTYTLVISDALGEQNIETILLVNPEELEFDIDISDFSGYNVSCFGSDDGRVQIEIIGGTEPYGTVFWDDAYFGTQRTFMDAGTYTINMSDANGCDLEYSFELTQPEAIEYSYELFILDPCISNDSEITLSIEGGVGGADHTLLDPNGEPILDGVLTEGTNTLIIRDQNGCEQLEYIEIDAFEQINADLGEDIEVEQGDALEIEVELDFELAYIEWSSEPFAEFCIDCESILFNAEEDLWIYVEAFDDMNCSDRDTLFVKVTEPLRYYLPNSIDLDGQEPNNRFNIYFNHEIQIVEFQVFSRWGELVYSEENPDIGNDGLGWDGRVNNKNVEQGVYVYKISYLNKEGSLEVLAGDLSVFH